MPIPKPRFGGILDVPVTRPKFDSLITAPSVEVLSADDVLLPDEAVEIVSEMMEMIVRRTTSSA
jgi:hypothetical protein